MTSTTPTLLGDTDDVTGFHQTYPANVYVVQPGDSLSLIAQRRYGSAALWPAIFAMNRGTVRNPDLIYPGQVLVLA